MTVRLVCYTKATPEFEAEGLTDLQELIAFCAKVSQTLQHKLIQKQVNV